MMFYWRIRTAFQSNNKIKEYTYFKTRDKYIPEMVVDLAVRNKMFLECFVQDVDEVLQITEEEYFKYMWE